MSDNGDKACPLCAEDMDLTDQQLKPCKCGYEICVWCWHQIMDMAEKENSEGRCPACRTSYNKERIVGMAVKCERLMNGSNTEKRYKNQKTKLKMSADARKNLSRVRVVQRNLVYIMGLPSHLADENVLERKEYFGQYGKILKLSISRPATTAQQAPNNCFSVYITYAREEDAVRCIQYVHNYTLESKSLRACFGTTKYCHSWLRNMTCSNPDCLYLHDIGCQDDSFTKDEIISAYSRSRVPQVALNNLQRRAGNVLPPPTDELGTNGTASSNTCLRMSSNNTTNHAKSANVSSGRSIVLPASASWGSRVSTKCPPTMTSPCFQNPVKQKPEFCNSGSLYSSVSSIKCISGWDDHVSVLSNTPDIGAVDGGSGALEPLNHVSSILDHPVVSDDSSETSVFAESSLIISAWDDDATSKAPEGRNMMHMDSQSSPQEPLKVNVTTDGITSDLCESTEIVFDETCNYAWDDDGDITSNQIKDPSFCHMDGKTTLLEALRCSSDQDSQTSFSGDTTEGDTPCTPGISRSSSQLLDTLTGQKDGLIGREIVSSDSANAKNLECNDSLSKRVDCDDAISNSIVPKEDTESVCLGISGINFDSRLVVDHQSKDKYQIVSSNNCSNFNDGSLAIELCQNYSNKEVELPSSMPFPHASVVIDSQFFPIDSPGWTSNQQSDLSLAMEKGDNYSLANDDQREKVSNAFSQTIISSCSLIPSKLSCSPTSNSCKEDACDLQYPIIANTSAMDAVVDQGYSILRDQSAVLSVLPKQDQQDNYAMQRKNFETPDMIRTYENKPNCLIKSDDLTTIKTENIDVGEGSIISNILSLDFDPWDGSLQSADNFAKLLNGMDKKGSSSTLSNSWKSQNNNQSRFSFARQENSTNVSATYSLATSHVEKLSSSNKESFKDSFHNNILLNTVGGPGVVLSNGSLFSSNNSVGTLRPNIPAPPGFSVPSKAPPPGFSSQERYENGFSSVASGNMFHGNPPLPSQFEPRSARNADDVEFIDPAILAVGKGILPLEVNNTELGFNSILPSKFCTTEGNRIQSLMQHSISAHHDRRVFNSNLADGLSSRFPMQINNTSYSSPLPFTHQQLRTSNILNSQWSDWQNVLNHSGVGMAEFVKNERFGMKDEHKFGLSSSNYLYTRPYGM
ncbi:hypothetical protein M5K25_007088 [Dendrobium thyrsiflorum]|uniref:CCR4-NOT transcription complex subunit 4 n=1 Tax=Dendrobium thyrsiflorum TaxID=117978 RepID=A0ABD0VED3_DENTH